MAVELFTTLTPIVPGQEANLRRTLANLDEGEGSPLARVPGVHLGRWVVIDHLAMGDPARRRPLRPAQLLFSVAFDGPVDPWLWGLHEGLGSAADDIWSHCSGWPGSTDAGGFTSWLLQHCHQHTVPFLGHSNATVEEILEGLALRDKFIHFVVWHQELGPADLRKAYEQAFGLAEANEP